MEAAVGRQEMEVHLDSMEILTDKQNTEGLTMEAVLGEVFGR